MFAVFQAYTRRSFIHQSYKFSRMPPKRASSSKRKALSDSEAEDDASQSKKKSKVSPTPANDNGQPRNMTLPVNIVFPARQSPELIRISAFNVAGLNASQKKVAGLMISSCRYSRANTNTTSRVLVSMSKQKTRIFLS